MASSHFEETPTKPNSWQRDPLAHHLATHTPIQVGRAPLDAGPVSAVAAGNVALGATVGGGAFHAMQHHHPIGPAAGGAGSLPTAGGWRIPANFGAAFGPPQPSPLYRSPWSAAATAIESDWNKNKVTDWALGSAADKWSHHGGVPLVASTPSNASDLARPLPQMMSPSFPSPLSFPQLHHPNLPTTSPLGVAMPSPHAAKPAQQTLSAMIPTPQAMHPTPQALPPMPVASPVAVHLSRTPVPSPFSPHHQTTMLALPNTNAFLKSPVVSANAAVVEETNKINEAMDTTPAIAQHAEFVHSPKEDERKSTESHSASYDTSETHSPSDDRHSSERGTSEEAQVDVDEDRMDLKQLSRTASPVEKVEEQKAAEEDVVMANSKEADHESTEKQPANAPEVSKDDEASRLLLNFSQQFATTMSPSLRISSEDKPDVLSTSTSVPTTPISSQLSVNFTPSASSAFAPSGNSAFSSLSASGAGSDGSATTATTSAAASTNGAEKSPASGDNNTNGSSFCRPPGLGPVAAVPCAPGQTAPLVCPICGFSCPSKFHYNSHMNTHGDHKCVMCDYKCRTEGRLKKHMRESHTAEQQHAAGLEFVESSSEATPSTPTSSSVISSTMPQMPQSLLSPPSSSAPISLASTISMASAMPSMASSFDTSNLSTTMASLVDVANIAAAAVAASHENGTSSPLTLPNTLSAALSMENLASSGGLLNSVATTGLPSALDHIKALADKSMMGESSVTLASALGAMSQAMSDGIDSSPERVNNAEPRRNSNGKMKQYKCKQCPHISFSKDDQWAHSRTHIPAEKQMNCPRCNFVTEYKHHLEYHIRNHIGSKPFQCKKCSYTCVNKSMLNSHMKSHTNVYQFRCMDCTYATKYCHSLKLHLKKYDHRRMPDGIEVNADGVPQIRPEPLVPYQNFGMKMESNQSPATSLAQTLGISPIVTSQSLNYASQLLMRQHQMDLNSLMNMPQMSGMPLQALKCGMCEFQTNSQDELVRHNMNHILTATSSANPIVSLYQAIPQMSGVLSTEKDFGMEHDDEVNVDGADGECMEDDMEGCSGSSGISTGSPNGSSKGSTHDDVPRKMKAIKLEAISQRLQEKSPSMSDDDEKEAEHMMEGPMSPSDEVDHHVASRSLGLQLQNNGLVALGSQFSVPPVVSEANLILQQGLLAHLTALTNGNRQDDGGFSFKCTHCKMAFQDPALYHIHMGYHGYDHAFTCNRCGFHADDSLKFNLHLLQASHE